MASNWFVFTQLVANDSYNVVNMEMFHIQIVHWNFWRFYWSKLINSIANILYVQLYLSNRVETNINIGKGMLQHTAIWGTATYSYMRHCNMQLHEAMQNRAIWGTATYSYIRHCYTQLYEALQHTAPRGTATYSYMRHWNTNLYEELQHTATWGTVTYSYMRHWNI